MEEAIVAEFTRKFSLMIDSCEYIMDIFAERMKHSHRAAFQSHMYWRGGAFSGILVHFNHTLTDKEREINKLVLKKIEQVTGNPKKSFTMKTYVDAVLSVLDELGYPYTETVELQNAWDRE